MKTNKLFALGSVLALAAVALAADGVILKRTAKEGDLHKYKLTASIDVGQGTNANLSGEFTEKILKVDTNGDVTEQQGSGAMKIEFGGQTMDAPEGAPKIYVYHPDMSLADIKGEGLTPGWWRMDAVTGLRFSATAVKVGDTWTSNLPADAKHEVPKTNATYKVLAEEKIGTVDTWKISASIKEAEGDTPAGTEGTFWVDKTDGSLVKEDLVFSNVQVPSAPAPVSGKWSLVLVS